MMDVVTLPESKPNQVTRLRSAVEDACAHSQTPCTPCQSSRVQAVVATIERERVESLRGVKKMAEQGWAHGAIEKQAQDALDGIPRDTQLDAALTLLAKAHTVLRRAKTTRPDPTFVKEIADYLAEHDIEVSDD